MPGSDVLSQELQEGRSKLSVRSIRAAVWWSHTAPHRQTTDQHKVKQVAQFKCSTCVAVGISISCCCCKHDSLICTPWRGMPSPVVILPGFSSATSPFAQNLWCTPIDWSEYLLWRQCVVNSTGDRWIQVVIFIGTTSCFLFFFPLRFDQLLSEGHLDAPVWFNHNLFSLLTWFLGGTIQQCKTEYWRMVVWPVGLILPNSFVFTGFASPTLRTSRCWRLWLLWHQRRDLRWVGKLTVKYGCAIK